MGAGSPETEGRVDLRHRIGEVLDLLGQCGPRRLVELVVGDVVVLSDGSLRVSPEPRPAGRRPRSSARGWPCSAVVGTARRPCRWSRSPPSAPAGRMRRSGPSPCGTRACAMPASKAAVAANGCSGAGCSFAIRPCSAVTSASSASAAGASVGGSPAPNSAYSRRWKPLKLGILLPLLEIVGLTVDGRREVAEASRRWPRSAHRRAVPEDRAAVPGRGRRP